MLHRLAAPASCARGCAFGCCVGRLMRDSSDFAKLHCIGHTIQPFRTPWRSLQLATSHGFQRLHGTLAAGSMAGVHPITCATHYGG
jgi:hypothetical protein